MISAQGVRNIVWIMSVFGGPVLAYYLTRVLGGISWICQRLHLCKTKLFLFFVLGFIGVWAIYWVIYLMARVFKKAGLDTKPANKPDISPIPRKKS